jgi:SNF2 family DNA or RNA helicase
MGWNHLSDLPARRSRWFGDIKQWIAKPWTPEQALVDIFHNLPSPFLDMDATLEGDEVRLIRMAQDVRPPGFLTDLFKYQRRSLSKMLAREFGLERTQGEVGLVEDVRIVEMTGLEGNFWMDTFNFRFYTSPPSLKSPCPFEIASLKKQSSLSFEENNRPTQRHLRIQLHPYPFDKQSPYYFPTPDLRGGIVCDRMGTGKTCTALALIAWTSGQLANVHDMDITQQLFHLGIATESKIRVRSFLDQVIQAEVTGTGKLSVSGNDMIVEYSSCSPMESDDETRRYNPPSLLSLAASTIIDKSIPYETRPDLPDHLQRLLNKARPFYYKWPTPIAKIFRYELEGSDWISRLGNETSERNLESRIKMQVSAASLVIVPDTLLVQWQNELTKHVLEGVLSYMVLDKSIVTTHKGKHQKLSRKADEIPSPETLASFDLVLISHTRFAEEAGKSQGFSFIASNLGPCKCTFIGNTLERDCKCEAIQNKIHMSIYGKDFKQGQWSPLCLVHWKRVIVDEGHHMSGSNQATLIASRLVANANWAFTGTPLKEIQYGQAKIKVCEDDVQRLGSIYGDFIKMQPFYSNSSRLWTDLVGKPFIHGYPGGFERLSNIMRRSMIKNNSAEVEAEIQLPPLHDNVVFMDFNAFQRKIYNVLIAGKDINAIDSERIDEDYFFHHKNRKFRHVLIDNLRMACFWFSNLDKNYITETYNNAQASLARVDSGKRFAAPEDRALLVKAITSLKEALQDPTVKIYDSFISRAGEKEVPDAAFTIEGLPSEGRLREAGFHAFANSIYGYVDHDEYGEVALIPWNDNILKPIRQAIRGLKNNSVKVESTKIKAEADDYVNIMDSDDEEIMEVTDLEKEVLQELESCHIVGSTSTKLNYLVSKVKQHVAEGEKVLVYCHFNSDIFYAHMALKAAEIPCLLFHSQGQPVWERAQNLTMFNKSSSLNVMVMLLDLAAEGVDLSTASRIYFMSPVWQAAKRRQAVSRAWRIGCTREVFVETLVIRGSLEEAVQINKDMADDTNKAADSGLFQKIIMTASYIPQSEFEALDGFSEPLTLANLDGLDDDYYDKDDEMPKNAKTSGEMRAVKTGILPSKIPPPKEQVHKPKKARKSKKSKVLKRASLKDDVDFDNTAHDPTGPSTCNRPRKLPTQKRKIESE